MSKIIRSTLFMFVITLVFTSLVTYVKIVNEDRINTNREIKLQKTILKVLGIKVNEDISPDKIMEIFKKRITSETIGDRTIYVCRDENGIEITGYAFPVKGPGFWGPVYAMAAVNRDADKLSGVSFYRHSETPGLGGRISENWFSGQFEGLFLKLPEGEKNYFTLTPEGDGKPENELDAITGASRTSEAVETFLNRELKTVIEQIKSKRR